MIEYFHQVSDDYLLMSKLIGKYMLEFKDDYFPENHLADAKRLRRLAKEFENADILSKLGYGIEKQNNKYRYTYKDKMMLDDVDSNSLLDILSLAEVSKTFHYRKDLPKLKKMLKRTFKLEDEHYEIYVGHNNLYGENKYLKNENAKLLKIKKAISSGDSIRFFIEYDEQNLYKENLLLKANENVKLDDGLVKKKKHIMKPYLVIHDSDETYISFKKNDALPSSKMNEKSYYVNMANIIFESMVTIKNKNIGSHKIDKKKIKYTIPTRESMIMKVSTSVGYLLKTRQADYSIIEENAKEGYMLIEFSEAYHGLNFIFMHGGPELLFKKFIDDHQNKITLEKWNDKVNNMIRHSNEGK